ncbi:putative aldouronate transport system substrate-binding protein [Paenibacillus sp. V4I9]|uniref:ABC transporter substrate-binding protein n=1 Tax=Paenibacillus sp. V4I9 TaxID=3042308 RepID=UPI00278901B7|nr:ABC transporter substrate-binding protein [Paenibacillus sp. V4I9]MDQ0889602.1 putative aldouronate transport system substrate-binding protein [Paenibacillus sp. V4I9]
MKTLKSVFSKTIILSMATALILSACGKTESPKPSTSTDVKATATTETAKPVTLKFVTMGPGKQADSQEVWDEFNKKLATLLPNTKVEFEAVLSTEFANKWKLMAASSEPIDIAWTGYLLDYPGEVNKGSYVELDALVDKYAPEIKKEVPAWVLDRARVNGKLYAIPGYQQAVDSRPTMRVPKEFIDKGYIDPKVAQDTFYKYGPVSKESFAVIEGYLEKLKANNQLRKGFSPNVLWSMYNHNFITTLPNYILTGDYKDPKSLKVVNQFETDKEQLFIKTMTDWYAKGYIRKDILSLQNQRQDEGKPDGNIAWFHSMIGSIEDQSKAESTRWGFPVQVIPMEEKYVISALSDATNLAISRTSKNPERAMQLLNLLNTAKGKDLYNLLVWGIEGKHYKKISDNKIETIGYQGSGTADAKYGAFKYALGNTANSFETQADPTNFTQIWKDTNAGAVVSPLLGFKPNLDPIKTDLAQVQAVVKEYAGAPSALILESGAVPDSDAKYKEFMDKMKKAGSDKVTAELQKQVDEFLKTKK